jgi:hypothetical protein
MKSNKKKSNSTRKIIPAAGMLMVSALMLSTSTYAWFTMSREVEVKNIQMTATVPEDIQISLGALGTSNAAATDQLSDGASLAGNTGVLVKAGGASADDGNVLAPVNDWDWSNTADIANYYQLGKLIPASSTNGASVFFTPDANGVGKTVRADAQFIQADGGTPGGAGATQSGTGADTTKTFKTTLHAKTASDDNWNTATYSQSTGWNTTNDDGYYVDIPVWLRTSSRSGASINVEAYVIPKTNTQTLNTDNEALYRAVRVAILDTTQVEGASTVTPTGLLPVADGMTGIASDAAGTLADSPFSGDSVLNWYNGTGTNGENGTVNNVAVKAASADLGGTQYNSTVYGPATVYDNTTPAQVVALAAGQGTEYGKPTKMIIRVWLEGEDKDCWNDTAGQDWSINLKFNNGSATSHDDIAGNATPATASTSSVTATVAEDGAGGLAVSYGTMPTGTITKYTYDGNDYDSLGTLESALVSAGSGEYTVTVSYIP